MWKVIGLGSCLLLVLPFSEAFAFHGKGARGVVGAPVALEGPRFLTTTSNPSPTLLSAKKKSTSKPAVVTYKKAEFVADLAERTGLSKKEAELSLQEVLLIIQEQISDGKKISFPGFGSFTLKDRAARNGRNPQTGEPLTIPASKSPSFSASKTWKDEINGK